MDSNQYKGFWEQLNSPMKDIIVRLRAALLAQQEFAGKFEFDEVTLETDTEDYFVSLIVTDIRGAEKRAVVAVEFELRDEPQGANIALTVDDVQEQTSWFTYIPNNYREDVVTLDLDELRYRVDQVPFDTLVEHTENALYHMLGMDK